jgi:hypothetical protein
MKIKINFVLSRSLVFILFVISFLGFFAFPASAAFRFVSWGDAQDNGSNLPITSRQAATLNPNLTIFNGDFEADGTTTAGLNTMVNAMNGISTGYPTSNGMYSKSFLVRGNHDTHVGTAANWSSYMNNAGKVSALGIRNYTELNEDLTYSYDYDNVRFIALDYPGYSTAQITWLDSRLLDVKNNHPEINHVFVYTHVPFYCVDGHCSCTSANDSGCTVSGQLNLIAVINKYQVVSAVFHGHEHILSWTHIDSSRVTIPGGITYGFESFLTSPSGTSDYNSMIKTYRVDDYSTQRARAFAAIDVNGLDFTVNFYRVGTTTPVWTRTFRKTGVPPVTLSPTLSPIPTPTGIPTTPTSVPTTNPLRTFYASPGGTGTICSFTSPCTLNTGLGKLAAGVTLYLRGGTYRQTVDIVTSGTVSSPVVVSGYSGETPIVDGGGSMGEYSALFRIHGNYVHLKNVEITGGGMGLVIFGNFDIASQINSHNHISNGILITGTSNGSIVEDSLVHDTCEYNINGTGGHWASGLSAARAPTNATIRRNKVYNNWGEGLSTYAADHITIEDNVVYDNWQLNMYIQNVQYALVQRNLIYYTPNYPKGAGTGLVEDNETADAAHGNSAHNTYINNFVMGAKGNFVHWSGSTGMSNALIANNTFVNTIGRPTVDISGTTNTNVRFVNNLIVQDDALAIARGGVGVTFSNNLWSKAPPSNFMGTNSIVGNPMLSRQGTILPGQLTGSWFMLTSSSPAINRAVSLPEVTGDYFKSQRPFGSFPDIGGHEYGGSAPQPTNTGAPTPSVTLRPTPTSTIPTPTPVVNPPATPTGIVINAPPPEERINFSKLYGAIQTGSGAFSFSEDLTLGNIISALLSFIFPLAGLILLLFIILGGFRYMTSAGDPKAIQSAKSLITTAFMGFIIIFLAYWLTRLVATVLGLEQIKSIF